jgi:NhaP-type Na+/H+ or K+/H+ antiporter
MTEHILIALAAVLVLGVGAHWLAWRVRVPAILPLLVVGLLVGPGAVAATGKKLLDPDALFGGLLLPCVSLSVAVILFEGGLSLRLSELKDVGHVVRNLCSGGVLITWGLVAFTAWALGLLGPSLALLLGAILTVTGPTVIGPLLQHVRMRGPAATVLKWEGIVVDPIGAMLALLVFEVAQATTLEHGATVAAMAFVGTIVVGGIAGALGGVFLVECVRRHWCPDFLENAVALMVVIGVYAGSNALQEESGLLAVTVLGILVANRLREQELRHIVEFKENLKVLLLSSLFIVLAARLGLDDLRAALGWRSFLFVAVLIAVIRPLSVAASTIGPGLTKAERLYVGAMAPRGIIACAVSAVFALRLEQAGHPEALALPSLTVLVIVITVSVYGLLSAPLARRLGLADPNPQGLLVLGAHPWARHLAQVLKKEGVEVLLIDNNYGNVAQANIEGLRALHANVLSEYVISELDLGGIGRLLAMTPNDEVNALATERLGHLVGRANVFQLAPRALGSSKHDPTHHHRVHYLFGVDETFWRLSERFEEGAALKTTRLGPEFTYVQWRATYGGEGLPLFVLSKGRVEVFATDLTPSPGNGDVLVSLVTPRSDATSSGRVLAVAEAPATPADAPATPADAPATPADAPATGT